MSTTDRTTDRIRAMVRVRVPQAEAFRLFTEQIDGWWRQGVRFRHGGSAPGLIHLEPRLDGRFVRVVRFRRPRTCGRGRPRARLAAAATARVLVAQCEFTPTQTTTVEVTFESGEGATGNTLVTVVHSGWDAIPPDHSVRHGLPVAEFLRMMGGWWGDQLASLRALAAAPQGGGPGAEVQLRHHAHT